MVDEGIRSEFIAIVNYGIIGLVQLELGYAETDDMTEERALELYDRYAKQALELMLAKNHDYDEAWRSMRVSSYTDLILMKIYRTKQIEGHDGATLVSEALRRSPTRSRRSNPCGPSMAISTEVSCDAPTANFSPSSAKG